MIIPVTDDVNIIVTSTPIVLRANKVAGMFAAGSLDLSDPDSIANYGRGKCLEIAPTLITTGLFGTIGKIENQEFCHISGIVISSDCEKLPKGLLLQFCLYGYELDPIKSYQQDIEINCDLGLELQPKVIKFKFDRSIGTRNGSTIKPPSISFRSPVKGEEELAVAATNLFDRYPENLINPLTEFTKLGFGNSTDSTPALAQSKSN
jgi:hypothetical protein